MRHDVASLKVGEQLVVCYPDLAELAAFAEFGAGDNDPYARFTVLYCAPDSPVRDLPLDDKKRECFRRAGIAPGDPRRAAVERWEDAGVVAMARDYVRQHNSLKYALLFHGRESAWQTIEQLSTPIVGAKTKDGDDDEAKTQTAYKTRRDNLDSMFLQVPKLDELSNELFLDDEQLGAATLRTTRQNTPTAENWAKTRQFVPLKP